MNHDVIVIGASAGGVEVLLEMVAGLPPDLPASIYIVVHMSPYSPSLLPEILSGRGPLPARYPIHDENTELGRIYVAPPDNHLLLRDKRMQVVRGPKENGHRPSADALFRTAAATHASRVIGVVLSGYQDCGTAGMMSIKARGGLSVVQTPESAQVDEMPRSVLSRVPVDHLVEPAELAPLLVRLVNTPAGHAAQPDAFVHQLEGEVAGSPASLVCPLCQGALTEARPGAFEHFRCHVGHAFSLDSLVREQGEEMERALWAAVRALEEGTALSRRISANQQGDMKTRFTEKAITQSQQADLIREILLHGGRLSRNDTSA